MASDINFHSPVPNQGRRSNSMNVPIVEEEALVARDLEPIVEDTGHHVLGQATTIAQALPYAPRVKIGLVDMSFSE